LYSLQTFAPESEKKDDAS
jgi:hypothetical protein